MRIRLILLLLTLTLSSQAAEFNHWKWTLLKHEGLAFTNAKYDRGSWTKAGITYVTFLEYHRQTGRSADLNGNGIVDWRDLRILPLETVFDIYERNYWDAIPADDIRTQIIAEVLVDMLVNCGKGRDNSNIRGYQRLIGVPSTGRFLSMTLARTNDLDQRVLLESIKEYRRAYYRRLVERIPAQAVFLRGWLIRVNSYTF
jgi:lysozyme family protein